MTGNPHWWDSPADGGIAYLEMTGRMPIPQKNEIAIPQNAGFHFSQ
jgi:hypothetical protein